MVVTAPVRVVQTELSVSVEGGATGITVSIMYAGKNGGPGPKSDPIVGR